MATVIGKITSFFMAIITFLSGLFGYNINGCYSWNATVTETEFYEEFNLPSFNSGKLNGCFVSSDNTTIGRFEKTSIDDYTDYLCDLTDAGFTVYYQNEIDGNHFATLYNDETTVNISFYTNTKTFRIIAEPKGALYPLTDTKEGDYETLLTGMKGETVVSEEGMGFIIRLNDGSFCIIDGGMGDPDSVDSDKLMNILNSQKPADVEKPVIAAWIFTHLHGDHVGVFNCFSIDHHDDVVIENFYFNFPREEEIAASDSTYMLDNSIYRYNQFLKCLTEYYDYIPVVKLHSGNKFEVRNASFEVLYAYDDLYPKTIVDGGMNENSLLLKMTVNDQTIMWTGDFAPNAMNLVLDEYSDALSADILQLPHHGINGSIAFFKAVNPTYTLLPIWESGLTAMLILPHNTWLVNNSDMKQMIATCCGTWTIKLPYEPNLNNVTRIPSLFTKNPSYPTLIGE